MSLETQIEALASRIAAEIKAVRAEIVSSGGISEDQVVAIAEGLDTIAADAFSAAQGNPAATTTFVSAPPRPEFSPNCYCVSLADNNNFFVNDVFQGAYNRGQSFEFDAAQGDKVTSEKGHSGIYSIAGGAERPVELASAANAGRQFFWFAFRSSPQRHIVQALALTSRVRVYGPNPTVNPDGTSPDTPIQDTVLSPFSFLDFQTPSTGEYYILASQPVLVTTTNQNLGQDQRVLAPLSNEIFGHTKGTGSGDARISALFAGTITVYQSNGVVASANVAPGSPLSLHGNDGSPINLSTNVGYGTEGWFIVRANVPIAGFSGADAAGTNATTFQLLASASQLIGLPLRVENENNQNVNIAGCSEYEGNVYLYQNDGTLLLTRQITRKGTLSSPATTKAEQLHPADFNIRSNDGDFTVNVNRGAFLIADVPVNWMANFEEGNNSAAEDDETSVIGITPEAIKAEIREDANGLKRRRVIDGSGVETWVLV